MQNYTIIRKLGRGAQGTVFLVHDIRDERDEYVLKKIECNDEFEANVAFKEIIALQAMEHRNICGYKEFFIQWDKKKETIYVCIVMSYYVAGDLYQVLKAMRKDQKLIEETDVMLWFGYLIDAMLYVHGKGFIHRDLKPSNVFIDEDATLKIGDFGVSIVMEGTHTKTCTGTLEYLAPEVLERHYDDRSDVWSLGCILFEMSSCALKLDSDISEILFEIKKSPQLLEEMLLKLQVAGYSRNLCNVIRMMLRRNFEQRPSLKDLSDLPWVNACIMMQNDKIEDPVISSGPTVKNAALIANFDQKSMLECLKELQGAVTEKAIVSAALGRLIILSTSEDPIEFPKATDNIIIKIMEAHPKSYAIQERCCYILRCLVPSSSSTDSLLFSANTLLPVMRAIHVHPGVLSLQREACTLLWALSTNEECAVLIGKNGGVQDILAALRTYPDNSDLVQACCSVIWSLTVHQENAYIVREEKGVLDILNSLRTHSDSESVLEAACAALWSLSVEDKNVETIANNNGIELLITIIHKNVNNIKVVKQSCLALAALCVDDVCAFRLWDNEERIDGIELVFEILSTHRNSAELVENACILISELAIHDEIRDYMKEKDIADILDTCRAANEKNNEISAAIEDAKMAVNNIK